MNPQNELFDAIENYLNEGMAEHERFAFEERMSQDKALADKVAEVRASNEAIYYASLAELKDTIGQDLKNIKYKEPIEWKKIGTISAFSLAIVASLTTYIFSTRTSRIETNKIETNKNDLHEERASKQSSASNSARENSAKIIDATETTINNQLSDTHSTNPQPIITDTAVKKYVIEHNSIASENKSQANQAEPSNKKVEAPVLSENKITCDKSFKINTEASCREKETGSITIISDGAYTYTYQIDIQSKTGSKGLFPNLSPGVYELMVTYGKECAYKKNISVEEKWCAMNESYSFNPDYNEKWIFNYETGASGTFTIFDKSGKDIYSNTFGSGNEEWNGNNRQGVPVAVGVYFAFINYSDGRKEKVELTIVR